MTKTNQAFCVQAKAEYFTEVTENTFTAELRHTDVILYRNIQYLSQNVYREFQLS